MVLKFDFRGGMFYVKMPNSQTDRQTDRQTNPPHPYTGGRNFFMPVFDTFSPLHYIRFAHSVREG